MLTQSLAIIEYLEETHPEPPLLPRDPAARARVRAIALQIACDIHPLDNLRVLNYLIGTLGVIEGAEGRLVSLLDRRRLRGAGEDALARSRDRPLLPRRRADARRHLPRAAIANARRFDIDLSPYPTLIRIEAACNELPAFADAAPARQPDAE